jgi:hypothetical protein
MNDVISHGTVQLGAVEIQIPIFNQPAPQTMIRGLIHPVDESGQVAPVDGVLEKGEAVIGEGHGIGGSFLEIDSEKAVLIFEGSAARRNCLRFCGEESDQAEDN